MSRCNSATRFGLLVARRFACQCTGTSMVQLHAQHVNKGVLARVRVGIGEEAEVATLTAFVLDLH